MLLASDTFNMYEPALNESSLNGTLQAAYGNDTHLWWILEKTVFALDMIMVLPICFGNILVLLAIKTTAKLQLTSNLLLVNLAWTDLLTGIIAIPWACMVHYSDLGLEGMMIPCLLTYVLSHIPLAVSCLTILWMAVLRFIAIVYPLKHKLWVTRLRVKVIIVSLWIYICCLVIGFATFANKWSEENPICDLSSTLPGIYVTIFAGHLVIVCIIATALYIYIGITIVRSKVWVQQWAQPKTSTNKVKEMFSQNTTRSSDFGSNSSLNQRPSSIHDEQRQGGGKGSCKNMIIHKSKNTNESNLQEGRYTYKGAHFVNVSSPNQESTVVLNQQQKQNGYHNGNSPLPLKGQRSPLQMGKRMHPNSTNARSPSPHLGRKAIPAMGVNSIPLEGRRTSQNGGQDSAKSSSFKRSSTRRSIQHHACQRQDSTCRMVKMLATILGCFYACWLPSLTKVFIAKFVYKSQAEPAWLNFFEQAALTILYSNSLLNPIIYAGMNRTFYRVFRKLLHLEEPAPRDSSTLS